MAINKLTDLKIQAFIRKTREGRAEKKMLGDGGSLYLEVSYGASLQGRTGGKRLLGSMGQ